MNSLNLSFLLDSIRCKFPVPLDAVEDLPSPTGAAICAPQSLSSPEGHELDFSPACFFRAAGAGPASDGALGERGAAWQGLLCCCSRPLPPSLGELELHALSNTQELLHFPLSIAFSQKHVQKPQCSSEGIWDPLERKLA